MSTARRFQWLKYLFCLTLLIGMSARPAFAAPDNAETGSDIVETLFWYCLLDDHKPTTTQSSVQCCDGDGCYTCLADFSECWISSDPQGRAKAELESPRPNIRPMQERPSPGQLQSICESVVANFASLDGFGYTCLKRNCDGKGNDCSIICHDDRRCAAQTPDVIRGAVSLRGILQNGDNIDRRNSGSSPGSGDGGGGGEEDGGSPCPDGCFE